MIRYTLFLYIIFSSCNTLACARTNVDIHGFFLMQKNIELHHTLLINFQERIINHEMQKFYLMRLLQNQRISSEAYFARLYQLNKQINQHKRSQSIITLERNKDIANNILKVYLKKLNPKPVFNQSEIQNLKNTHESICRGMLLLQHIAHDEQQTLARLKQTALSSSL